MKKIFSLCFSVATLLFPFLSSAEVTFTTPPPKDKIADVIHWVHPRLDFTTQYDDNLFLEPDDEVDGFVFTTSPGLSIVVPFEGAQHLFTLDYQVDFLAFTEVDDENFIAHTLKGSLDWNFPKFHVNTSDIFRRTALRSDTEFTDRIDRYENNYAFKVGTSDWNRLSFEAGYDLYFTFYDDDSLEVIDHYEHVIHGTGFYRLFTKTKALLDYRHGFLSYPDDINNRDGDFDEVSAGVTGELFTRMVGTAKVGYQNRDYDNGQDLSSVVVDLSATEYFSEATVVTVAYQRAAKESVFLEDDFYLSDSVSATLLQKLFWGLDGKLGFTYQNNGYGQTEVLDGATAERDDDLFGVLVGLSYPIREWLNTSLDYNYYERDSNFDSLDYTDNRVMWKISAKY
ncbi:MAG: outer membrane beta-barrel protein [Chlamydiae bacterium]|nr:outer membrane beta-barrel protein [Chlamydiota bacterium]MBI3267308.1 outer membrane beta-barrel protein [Chlamydiota bacterium]